MTVYRMQRRDGRMNNDLRRSAPIETVFHRSQIGSMRLCYFRVESAWQNDGETASRAEDTH